MTLTLPRTLAVLAAALTLSPWAHAHGDVKCTPLAPKAEWRPQPALAKQLTDAGWVIRRIAVTDSCYEVYAKDPQGRRVEAFFHPVSLERVERP